MNTKSGKKKAKPKVHEYQDFRQFVRDYIEFRKANSLRRYSLTQFSKDAGYINASALHLVLEKKRNLPLSVIPRLCQALQLNKQESEYFTELVHLNQATVAKDQQYHATKIVNLNLFKKFKPIERAAFQYLSNWYVPAIRELMGVMHFKDDPAWIAKHLSPPISEAEARRALSDLEQLQLIKKNKKNEWELAGGTLNTEDEMLTGTTLEYHRSMVNKGLESIDRFDRNQRKLSGVTVSLSAEKFNQIAELMNQFRQQILAIAAEDAFTERVYQVNMQLFPLTKKAD